MKIHFYCRRGKYIKMFYYSLISADGRTRKYEAQSRTSQCFNLFSDFPAAPVICYFHNDLFLPDYQGIVFKFCDRLAFVLQVAHHRIKPGTA